ncbi:metallophosphoesterase [Methanohalobium evestigatum Z-7303]|uniref:Metallophosphoesterase n=1 Tax=Methanohalobium evestigatum (strain ATCC BAA-1072 / DSM 3721 / NBRC 107634 / OCM 161 / Z-7303) TaxID=644295 RepID=D7EAU9_METEZ|nr:metallophosphoesterase [Methanohalobium evestigatum]ADI74466.1 metallophosphoesterase [Methanohalobium evestigatum Z-7303]
MRILAITDPHGNYSKIEPLLQKSGDIDLILIAGDLTNFGPDEKAEELVGMFEAPVLAVPGNCDPVSLPDVLDRLDVNLHNTTVTRDDVTFIGFGGSNPTPFNTPFELEEEEIEKHLENLVNSAEESGNITVLLTHAPPYCTLDEVSAGNVGCKSIIKFMDKVDLVVCGHIHEARGVMEHGKSVIVNPGMASDGYGALININKKTTPKIDVQIIKA